MIKPIIMSLLILLTGNFSVGHSHIDSLVNKTIDTVVKIQVTTEIEQEGQPPIIFLGTGGGVFISKDGYILTAAHVVDRKPLDITVIDFYGNEFKGTVIKSNKNMDLALLSIPTNNARYARLAKRGSVRIGHRVVAIGHPLGLDYMVTSGIISRFSDVGSFLFFHHDAVLSFGSSGGPLFNSKGEVVGINHAFMRKAPGLGIATALDSIYEFCNGVTYKTRRKYGLDKG